MSVARHRKKRLTARLNAIEHFEAEALRLAGSMSDNQARFLRVAKGKEMEPVGRTTAPPASAPQS